MMPKTNKGKSKATAAKHKTTKSPTKRSRATNVPPKITKSPAKRPRPDPDAPEPKKKKTKKTKPTAPPMSTGTNPINPYTCDDAAILLFEQELRIAGHDETSASLQAGAYVNDTTIQLLIKLAIQQHSVGDATVSYIVPHHFKSYSDNATQWCSRFSSNQKRSSLRSQCRTVDLRGRRMWLMPVCKNNNHWQLVCFVWPTHYDGWVTILDSMNQDGTPDAADTLLLGFATEFATLVWLDKESTQRVHLAPVVSQVPIQPNDFDCGFFAILNAINCVTSFNDLCARTPSGPLDFSHSYTPAQGVAHRETCRELVIALRAALSNLSHL